MDRPARITRRTLLGAGLAVVLGACRRDDEEARTGPPVAKDAETTTLSPTPECTDADDPTPAQTEGPYFTPGSPERTSLLGDAGKGTKLVLTGTVVTTSCRQVARALLDFWQADSGGSYDNVGYRLRGHQFSDDQGRFRLETIVPGLYPGRTRHIHVKVQPPGGKVLTTQLYFPGEAANAEDRIFRSECLIDLRDGADGKDGTYTFVV